MQHKDSIVISSFAGIIAGTAYQVFVWIFYVMGIAKITPFQLGAYILIQPGLDITLLSSQLLGMVQHYANSILIAFITFQLLRFIGTDYPYLKGLSAGAIIYFLLYGVLAKTVIPVNILQPDIATSAIFMVGNLVYGLVTVLMIVKSLPRTYSQV